MPNKKNHIPGTVRPLSSGLFQARYKRQGSQKYESAPDTFRTEREAWNWLAAMAENMRRGEYTDPKLARTTFQTWAERWHPTTANLSWSSRNSYRSILENHLYPEFASMPIEAVDTAVVKAFLMGLIAEGMSKDTVKKIKLVVGSVLDTAVEGHALRSGLGKIKIGKSAYIEKTFLNPAQIHQLAEEISTHYQRRSGGPAPIGRPRKESAVVEVPTPQFGLAIRFVAYTGLRAGELWALRVSDIDFLRGHVKVMRSLKSENGLLVEGETKNSKPRTVPLPAWLQEEVAEFCQGKRPSDHIFTSLKGGLVDQTNFYPRHFTPATERAGVAPMRFHDLRHTYAALLIGQGANPLSVKARLGHSSIVVTMDIYGHLFEHLEEELTTKLDALGRGSFGGPTVVEMPRRSDQGL